MSPALFAALPALASTAGDAMVAELLDDRGWSAPSTTQGVDVSSKTIAGLPLPAFRGRSTVDVPCEAYFVAVSDPDRHKAANALLRESRVVSRNGDSLVFFQVIDLPIVSDRYWINRAVNQRDVGGQPGHFRQIWQAEKKDDHPALRDDAEQRYDAVFTEVNFGYWDLLPAGDAACTVTYAVASDPGGSVPASAGAWASRRSLPDNLNGFLQAARR